MKKNLLLFVSLLSFSLLHAQLKQIAESPKFEEPEEGYAKIIQLRNGNTAYIHITLANGINIRIYDANRIEKAVNNIIPAYGKLQGPETAFGDLGEYIESVFEIDNDLVLFVNTNINKAPTLSRLIFDGNTAKLKDESIIAAMQKSYSNFLIEKDNNNDGYVIKISGKAQTETESHTKFIFYGIDHKETGTIYFDKYPVKDWNDKWTGLSSMLLINGKLYTFFSVIEKKDRGLSVPLYNQNTYMLVFEKGKPYSGNYTPLNLPQDLPVWSMEIKYNAAINKIYALILENNLNESYKRSFRYKMDLNIIDLQTNKIKFIEDIGYNEKVNDDYKKRFSIKADYAGVPQNFYINDDGSFSIVCEENHSINSSGVKNNWIGKLLHISYDKNGNFSSGYVVPKYHNLFKRSQEVFVRKRSETKAELLHFAFQYKTFLYLDGVKNKYLLFNDTEKNNDVKNDKFTAVAGVTDCDTYIYKMEGTEIIPQRNLAFGTASGGHNMITPSIADYNKTNNTLATLMIDKTSPTNKTVKLVWLQPQ